MYLNKKYKQSKSKQKQNIFSSFNKSHLFAKLDKKFRVLEISFKISRIILSRLRNGLNMVKMTNYFSKFSPKMQVQYCRDIVNRIQDFDVL